MGISNRTIMSEINIDEANKVNVLTDWVRKRKEELRTAPIVPSGEPSRLITELWRKTESEPIVIRRARLF